MAKFYIHPWAKVGSLKNSTVMDLTAELANMKIENDLRRQVQDDIRRLRDMGTYRGRRHAMGLPVRGQKTRTQVCGCLELGWVWLLMVVLDCDRTTVKQDGTRWNWEGVDVRWKDMYVCIILYSTEAWNGVYESRRNFTAHTRSGHQGTSGLTDSCIALALRYTERSRCLGREIYSLLTHATNGDGIERRRVDEAKREVSQTHLWVQLIRGEICTSYEPGICILRR
jgi:hypothetical protein